MVKVEYKVVDIEPSWQKFVFLGTLLLLVFLIPSTALGYFAEKSLPNQPLYPMKRGIENVILALEFLSPSAKSQYLLTMANTRLQEASAVVASPDPSSYMTGSTSLTEVVFTVDQAVKSIQNISDPTQKQLAVQQLQTSILQYKKQLAALQTQVATTASPTPSETVGSQTTTSSETPTSTPTPLPTQTTQTQTATNTLTPTPTIPPQPSPSQIQAQNDFQNQITQTSDQLQSISDQVNQTLSPQEALPSPTPTPTPNQWRGSTQNNQYNQGTEQQNRGDTNR